MDANKLSYTPFYLQVKEIILKRIVEDVYPQGEVIPSESTLAEEFGTSISTIRQALSILAADGTLTKKQGKGTFVSDQKTTLRFFTWLSETKRGEQILSHVIDLFQKKHLSLSIETVPTTYHVAKKNLLKLISSGNAPDVAQIQSHWTSYFASMGGLERLENLLDTDNLAHRFEEKDLCGGKYRDRLYSVGWGLCPVSLLVNKNIMREAGVQMLDFPMTFETFFVICKKVDSFYKERGQEKYCYGLSVSSDKETDFLTVYFFLQAFQGGLLDEQGEVIFNSPGNITGFRWLRNFVKSFSMFKSDIPTIRKRFAHGDIAFISDAPWVKYQLEEYTGEPFEKNFQVVLNPVYQGTKSYSWNYNHALAICSQSQHKLYAARFIEDLTNDPEMSSYYYSQTGNLPVNKTQLEDSHYSSDFFKAYKHQLTHARCINAQNAMFHKAMAFCIDSVRKILYEEVDIESELDEKEYYLKLLYED